MNSFERQTGRFLDKNMTNEIWRQYVDFERYAGYPRCGLFYALDGELITREFCQWAVDPASGRIFAAFDGFRMEHRDMWDAVIRAEHPKAAEEYGDDHKAMPRGRVELLPKSGAKLHFRVTLCPCLNTDAFRRQVLSAFGLQAADADVTWSYGTMNYICRDCRPLDSESGQRD